MASALCEGPRQKEIWDAQGLGEGELVVLALRSRRMLS
jgi:hypothetical protein